MTFKSLILFIQSPNEDPYINIITHCVEDLKIEKIIFIEDNKLNEQQFESLEIINKIRNKINELSENYPCYQQSNEIFPKPSRIQSNLIKISFSFPQQLAKSIKKLGIDHESMIVDITGCSKRVSSDVIVSSLSSNISNIYHFQLANKVYNNDWKKSGKQKLYHDLFDNIEDKSIPYFIFDSFGEQGITRDIIHELKYKKNIFQVLFIVLFVITILSTWILSGNPISSQVVTFVSLFATIMIAMSSLINTGLNVKKEVK